MLGRPDQKGSDCRAVAAACGVGRQHPGSAFGGTRGEEDIARTHAQPAGDGLARILDQRPRGAALGMHRGRIADDIERGEHGLAGFGPQRRRRVPIEVCAPAVHSVAHLDDWMRRAHRLLADRDAVDHLLQRDAVQEGRNLLAQRVPQAVGEAALAGHAGLGLLAAAARHAHVLVDRGHDLGNGDGGGRPAQAIAAEAAAHALDQAGAAQFEEQLLQVGQRDLLALGDGRQGQRAVRAILGEIGHGHHRVPASGIQLHGCLAPTGGGAGPGRSRTGKPQLLRSIPLPVLRDRPGSSSARTVSALSNCSKLQADIWKFRARESSIFAARGSPVTCTRPATA